MKWSKWNQQFGRVPQILNVTKYWSDQLPPWRFLLARLWARSLDSREGIAAIGKSKYIIISLKKHMAKYFKVHEQMGLQAASNFLRLLRLHVTHLNTK